MLRTALFHIALLLAPAVLVMIDLLVAYGVDPHRVRLPVLFKTYDSALFERFLAAGVNLTQEGILAEMLAYHTSNNPLFDFAKRHLESIPGFQHQLDMARSST